MLNNFCLWSNDIQINSKVSKNLLKKSRVINLISTPNKVEINIIMIRCISMPQLHLKKMSQLNH